MQEIDLCKIDLDHHFATSNEMDLPYNYQGCYNH